MASLAACKRRDEGVGLKRAGAFRIGNPLEDGPRGRKLAGIRRRIDRVDGRLVKLLAQRCGAAMEAAAEKKRLGRGLVNRKREEEVLSSASSKARESGIDPDIVKRIFREIIRLARACENELLSGKHS